MNLQQKITIAKELKNIYLEDAENDFIKLQNIDLEEVSSLSRIGLKFIDSIFSDISDESIN
jgi:hypothetical protein